MSLKKITQSEIAANAVESLADRLIGTANENKRKFDRLISKVVIPKYNMTIDELSGAQGAAAVGAAPFAGVAGTTVQAQIQNVQGNITDMVSGVVPDGTITNAKLAAGAVTTDRLAAGAVTADKIAVGIIVPQDPYSQIKDSYGNCYTTKVHLSEDVGFFYKIKVILADKEKQHDKYYFDGDFLYGIAYLRNSSQQIIERKYSKINILTGKEEKKLSVPAGSEIRNLIFDATHFYEIRGGSSVSAVRKSDLTVTGSFAVSSSSSDRYDIAQNTDKLYLWENRPPSKTLYIYKKSDFSFVKKEFTTDISGVVPSDDAIYVATNNKLLKFNIDLTTSVESADTCGLIYYADAKYVYAKDKLFSKVDLSVVKTGNFGGSFYNNKYIIDANSKYDIENGSVLWDWLNFDGYIIGVDNRYLYTFNQGYMNCYSLTTTSIELEKVVTVV